MRKISIAVVAVAALVGSQAVGYVGEPSPQGTHVKTQNVNVLVNSGKYSPSVVNVKAGRMVHMNFKLGPRPGCGDTVVIKDFKINKKLAKGKTTTVMFTPKKPGRYTFTCGMNMMKGTIVVK